MIRIDVRLILKLAMLVFVFSQDASSRKFAGLVTAAVLVYLHQTGLLSPLLRWLTPVLAPAAGQPPHGAGAGASDAGGEGTAAASAAVAAPQSAAGDLLNEAKVFVVGFFTSMVPGFHDDPEVRAAALAAGMANDAPAPMM